MPPCLGASVRMAVPWIPLSGASWPVADFTVNERTVVVRACGDRSEGAPERASTTVPGLVFEVTIKVPFVLEEGGASAGFELRSPAIVSRPTFAMLADPDRRAFSPPPMPVDASVVYLPLKFALRPVVGMTAALADRTSAATLAVLSAMRSSRFHCSDGRKLRFVLIMTPISGSSASTKGQCRPLLRRR